MTAPASEGRQPIIVLGGGFAAFYALPRSRGTSPRVRRTR
jgi:hypothetical protein